MYHKDKHKNLRFDWNNLKIGDLVFDDCNGPCSGGISYGLGYLVIEITEKTIITTDGDQKKDEWNKISKYHVGPPYSYFLTAFQSS